MPLGANLQVFEWNLLIEPFQRGVEFYQTNCSRQWAGKASLLLVQAGHLAVSQQAVLSIIHERTMSGWFLDIRRLKRTACFFCLVISDLAVFILPWYGARIDCGIPRISISICET